MVLILWQIPKRIDLDRGTSTFFHYSAYSGRGSFALACGEFGLARLLYKAKVGHVGYADCRRGSEGLERFEAAKQRDTEDVTYFEEKGQCGTGATLVRMVKEREDPAIL